MSRFGLDTLLTSKFPVVDTIVAKLYSSNGVLPALHDGYLLPFGQWMNTSPWICYGFVPAVAVFLGMALNMFFLEWLITQSWMQKHLITYSNKETRAGELEKTRKVVSFREQLLDTLWNVGGPLNIIGVTVLRFSLEYLHGGLPTAPLPTLVSFLVDFILLAFIADFFLYWGHRIQHEIPYLWDHCHSVHHRLRTPSSASTAYIEPRDAILQSALPLVLAAFIIVPHPITHISYLYFHLCNNALNHSGIHHWFFNILTLKFLPLRCDNRLHDAHHRYSGAGAGKNYAEFTWIWDWMFGTYSQTAEIMTRKRE